MRNPDRIDAICESIKAYWHNVPDWRFMQLVNNVIGHERHNDGFYMEDDEFEARLRALFAEGDEWL